MNRPARHGRNDSSAGRRALQAERTGTLPGVRAFRAGGRKGALKKKSPLPSPPHPPSIPQKTLSGRMAGRGFPPGRTLTDGPPVRRRLLFLWRGWRLLSGGGKGLFAKSPFPPPDNNRHPRHKKRRRRLTGGPSVRVRPGGNPLPAILPDKVFCGMDGGCGGEGRGLFFFNAPFLPPARNARTPGSVPVLSA